MEFQIEQNYGDSSYGWIYFTAEGTKTIDELKEIAKKEMQKDWDKVDPALYFSEPTKPKTTIKVAEYKDGKKVPGGIRFKTKWC